MERRGRIADEHGLKPNLLQFPANLDQVRLGVHTRQYSEASARLASAADPGNRS